MNPRSTHTLLLSILVATAACGDRTPPVIVEASITPNTNPAAPLAASAVVRTDEPVTVAFRVEADGAAWDIDPGADLATEHQLPVLGLRADTDHSIVVVVTDASGNESVSDPHPLSTEPLPDDFPDFVLMESDPERMEPGVTLFNLMKFDGEPNDFGAAVVLDPQGEVVWYYKPDHRVGDARLLANGNLLYSSGREGPATEIDMLGNIVGQWHMTRGSEDASSTSIAVEMETLHHEVLEMPSGNLLGLSTELREYDDYPSSTLDPDAPRQLASVVGDVVVEFSRDGQVQRELKLLDILDPFRTGTGSLAGGFWEPTYGDEAKGALVDWAHTNAVFFDEPSNAFIVSVRRQDAVVKIDADSGEIIWILGEHDRWTEPWSEHLLTPRGGLEWPNHQHAPMVTGRGTILLFDNGSSRGGPYEEDPAASEKYSRAVEYEINEETMEVWQVWAYGGPGSEMFYSSFISDADWMPTTENVLITAGGIIEDSEGVATEESDGRRSARIVEVTHTTPSEKVFEVVVKDDWETGGWHVYRAERIPSLYGAGS